MAEDAGLDLQKAIYDALTTALSGVAGVYDRPPSGVAFPYVLIGDDTGRDDGATEVDLADLTLTLHIFSRYRGRKEVKEIRGLIYNALHQQSLPLDTWSLVTLRQDFTDTYTEGDGLTEHGVVRYRARAIR